MKDEEHAPITCVVKMKDKTVRKFLIVGFKHFNVKNDEVLCAVKDHNGDFRIVKKKYEDKTYEMTEYVIIKKEI